MALYYWALFAMALVAVHAADESPSGDRKEKSPGGQYSVGEHQTTYYNHDFNPVYNPTYNNPLIREDAKYNPYKVLQIQTLLSNYLTNPTYTNYLAYQYTLLPVLRAYPSFPVLPYPLPGSKSAEDKKP